MTGFLLSPILEIAARLLWKIHSRDTSAFGDLSWKLRIIRRQKRPTRFIVKSVDWDRRGYLGRLPSR
jgi:hypothetical protein